MNATKCSNYQCMVQKTVFWTQIFVKNKRVENEWQLLDKRTSDSFLFYISPVLFFRQKRLIQKVGNRQHWILCAPNIFLRASFNSSGSHCSVYLARFRSLHGIFEIIKKNAVEHSKVKQIKEQKKKHKLKGTQLATKESYLNTFLGKTNQANCQVIVQKVSNLIAA